MKYRIRKQNELKPSGVEWLGDIPKEWEQKKIKYLFSIGRGRVIAQSELEEDGIYPVYSSQTKNDGVLGYIKTYDFDCKQLTWTTDGANAGTVFLREGKHNCTNVCGTLQKKNNNFILKYLLFALQKVSPSYKRPDTNGAKIMNGEMAEIKVTFPSKIEQQKIANFLDEKSKIFDEAISKKEQLISKIELAKQSLISEVVTGKLKIIEQNSKLQSIKREQKELKSSNVEWLGDIPKNWQIKKLKYFTTKITSGSTPLGGSETYLDEGIPLLRSQNVHFKGLSLDNVAYISDEVHNQMKRSQLQERDVLINITGASIGRVAYVPLGFENGNVNQHVCIIRINHKVAYYKYISLFLSINYGQDQVFINQVGTSREGLSFEDLNNFIIVFPNLEEQQKISKYLDEKLIHFDNTIEKTKQSITKLKEAKEALISQAVTGKIEVL